MIPSNTVYTLHHKISLDIDFPFYVHSGISHYTEQMNRKIDTFKRTEI